MPVLRDSSTWRPAAHAPPAPAHAVVAQQRVGVVDVDEQRCAARRRPPAGTRGSRPGRRPASAPCPRAAPRRPAQRDQLVAGPEGPVEEHAVGAARRRARAPATAPRRPRSRPASRPCARRGSRSRRCPRATAARRLRGAAAACPDAASAVTRQAAAHHRSAAAAARPRARACATSSCPGNRSQRPVEHVAPREALAHRVGRVHDQRAATRAATAGPGSGRDRRS